ncbi:MAG: pantoate--beta-alanine ligase [Verrucomicrobiota bacterium]
MDVCDSISKLRSQLRTRRDHPVVFVPTMGALHEGHLSLVQIAREHGGAEATVVVSIYVNPTQFDRKDDLDGYPRVLDSDLENCHEHGVDIVFTPNDLYANDATVAVGESRLSLGLCGASRPGHFDGVCTVVAKLFNIVQPDAAVFGEKDFQQLAVIRRMTRDLDFPIEIVPGPIVREPDGLAMSSRNVRLSAEEREQAIVLHQALEQARVAVDCGERSASRLNELIASHISSAALAKIDYIELVDPDTLENLDQIDRQLLAAVAVFFGKTRLIDNFCMRSLDSISS